MIIIIIIIIYNNMRTDKAGFTVLCTARLQRSMPLCRDTTQILYFHVTIRPCEKNVETSFKCTAENQLVYCNQLKIFSCLAVEKNKNTMPFPAETGDTLLTSGSTTDKRHVTVSA